MKKFTADQIVIAAVVLAVVLAGVGVSLLRFDTWAGAKVVFRISVSLGAAAKH